MGFWLSPLGPDFCFPFIDFVPLFELNLCFISWICPPNSQVWRHPTFVMATMTSCVIYQYIKKTARDVTWSLSQNPLCAILIYNQWKEYKREVISSLCIQAILGRKVIESRISSAGVNIFNHLNYKLFISSAGVNIFNHLNYKLFLLTFFKFMIIQMEHNFV